MLVFHTSFSRHKTATILEESSDFTHLLCQMLQSLTSLRAMLTSESRVEEIVTIPIDGHWFIN